MTSEIIQRINPELPIQGGCNIIDIKVLDIPISLIEPFQGIPDFVTAYRWPYMVVVRKDDNYLAIGGHDKLQVVPGQLEVRCIEYVLADTSYESIAIEKIALFVTPLGGSASFAEIIRAVAFLIIYIRSLPDATIIEGWGGLRRGKDFEEGESLTKVLATRLGKSLDIARRYIYYGKFLSSECLEELAKSKAGRNFFDTILPKKTKLIDSMTGKRFEEITTAVSDEVLKWWKEYSTPKEGKAKHQETKQPSPGKAGKTGQQQGTQRDQGLSTTTQQPVGQAAAPVDQQAAVAPVGQPTGQTPTGQPAADPQKDGNQQKEADDITDGEHESDPEEEQAEENDITPGKDQQSPLYLVDGQASKNHTTTDIYTEMHKIGTKLIDASKEKPGNEALYRKIQEVMAELTTLLRMASEINRSLPTTTLAGAM